MNETVITWSVPNFITIFLMAVIGSLVFGFAVSAGRKVVKG